MKKKNVGAINHLCNGKLDCNQNLITINQHLSSYLILNAIYTQCNADVLIRFHCDHSMITKTGTCPGLQKILVKGLKTDPKKILITMHTEKKEEPPEAESAGISVGDVSR